MNEKQTIIINNPPNFLDEKFLKTFFITYRQFISPPQLLDKLIAQYKSQPQKLQPPQYERIVKEQKLPAG